MFSVAPVAPRLWWHDIYIYIYNVANFIADLSFTDGSLESLEVSAVFSSFSMF